MLRLLMFHLNILINYTVILTLLGSAFSGRTATTVRAYVTLFPVGTFVFGLGLGLGLG